MYKVARIWGFCSSFVNYHAVITSDSSHVYTPCYLVGGVGYKQLLIILGEHRNQDLYHCLYNASYVGM